MTKRGRHGQAVLGRPAIADNLSINNINTE